jgi:hypothetical protein
VKGPEIPDFDTAGVRELYIAEFGPKCAGWLVRRFKKRIRVTGDFFVHLPVAEEIPPWFDIAISFLRRRDRWRVSAWTTRGVRRWHVSRNKRIPQSIEVS